jgi:GNAT superfamily N-acetyltransferase
MPFLLVDPDDADRVNQAVALENTARQVDDPDRLEPNATMLSRMLRYGWDLEPDELYLYVPEGATEPVGLLEVEFPRRDNLHLGWTSITVHPDHRRQGHGSAMMTEMIRRTRAVGRNTLWIGAPKDDLGARAFAERSGFSYASHDARRRQLLSEVDQAEVDRLYHQAREAAADYVLERGTTPTPDDVLEQLVEVTAAINDAPMGDLTFEDEHFDLKRLKDFETASAGRQDVVYRMWARHRTSGEIGGHTVVLTNALHPGFAWQADTAVSRAHRGHRLGLLLKIEMMRWLAQDRPDIGVVETWNNADNDFMIRVNEAIGYRLNRVFATYELKLG